jgi:hypothetical protein
MHFAFDHVFTSHFDHTLNVAHTSAINLTTYFSLIILSALELHMSVSSQVVTVRVFQDNVKGIMDTAGQSKYQQLISKFARYIIKWNFCGHVNVQAS